MGLNLKVVLESIEEEQKTWISKDLEHPFVRVNDLEQEEEIDRSITELADLNLELDTTKGLEGVVATEGFMDKVKEHWKTFVKMLKKVFAYVQSAWKSFVDYIAGKFKKTFSDETVRIQKEMRVAATEGRVVSARIVTKLHGIDAFIEKEGINVEYAKKLSPIASDIYSDGHYTKAVLELYTKRQGFFEHKIAHMPETVKRILEAIKELAQAAHETGKIEDLKKLSSKVKELITHGSLDRELEVSESFEKAMRNAMMLRDRIPSESVAKLDTSPIKVAEIAEQHAKKWDEYSIKINDENTKVRFEEVSKSFDEIMTILEHFTEKASEKEDLEEMAQYHQIIRSIMGAVKPLGLAIKVYSATMTILYDTFKEALSLRVIAGDYFLDAVEKYSRAEPDAFDAESLKENVEKVKEVRDAIKELYSKL